VTLLGQGVGLGDPQRALPTPAMLGFWDSSHGMWGPEEPMAQGRSATSSSPRWWAAPPCRSFHHRLLLPHQIRSSLRTICWV